MSEQRKRLTDAEYRDDLLDRGIDPDGALSQMEADHLQAREDRKRLAAEVRKLSDYEQEYTGSMCWCNDGREAPCYVGTPSDMCLRLNLLLREVDPQ